MCYVLLSALDTMELLEYHQNISIPENSFTIGKRPDPTDIKILYYAPNESEKNIRTYHFISSSGPTLVSSMLRDVLCSIASDEIDFYSTTVRCKETTITDYWAIRPKILAECFDMKKSEYHLWNFDPNDPQYDFLYIVLNKNVPYDLHIVRSEEIPHYIVVDESIKQACFDAKLKGLAFCSNLDANLQDRSCCEVVE